MCVACTFVLPVFLCGYEHWTMSDEESQGSDDVYYGENVEYIMCREENKSLKLRTADVI